MNHNYTILITGEFSPCGPVVGRRNLATFAFGDNDKKRIAQLKQYAESEQMMSLKCPSCEMIGRIELHEEGTDVALFHFVVGEMRPNANL